MKRIFFIFIISFLLFSCSESKKPGNYISPDVVKDFYPVKDDSLAAKYAPLIEADSGYGAPHTLYYRASADNEGNTHITYHYVWEKEENSSSGIGPFFSRNIYTGGLKLQKVLFGKGDVELVSLVIGPSGKIKRIEYETAENYDPKKFSVTHLHVVRDEYHKEPVLFRVISWNHLFDYVKDNAAGSDNVIKLTPQYFREELWQEYEMVKEKETFFSRSRAHKEYEKEFAE